MPKHGRYVVGRMLVEASRMARAGSSRLEDVSRRYMASEDRRGETNPTTTRTGGPARPAGHDGQEIRWFHSIDLGDGQPTPGVKSSATLEAETAHLELPATLGGMSVLDVGTWDGYFAFEMERRGAASVTALDYYAWATDHSRWGQYHAATVAAGALPLPPDEVPEVWDPANLPGRAGFDQARAALNSRVRPVVGDFMTMDLEALGKFDIVLFLGVLYHLKDPFLALRRLRQVTRGVAVIETGAVVLPGWTDERLWMFIEGSELDSDPSNWWLPTSAGLAAMCRAAGFSSTRVTVESPEYAAPNPGYNLHYGRVTMQAHAQPAS